MAVIDPEILKILCLLGGVLKAPKKDNVMLEVCHSVSAPGGWPFLALDSRPLPTRGIELPEVIVMVELPLLCRGEFPTEKVDVTSSTPSPCMARPGKWAVWAGDFAPLILLDQIDK